jgi:hypothetical protein
LIWGVTLVGRPIWWREFACDLLVLLVRLELDPGQHGRVWESPCCCGSIIGRQSRRWGRPGSSTPFLIVRVLK